MRYAERDDSEARPFPSEDWRHNANSVQLAAGVVCFAERMGQCKRRCRCGDQGTGGNDTFDSKAPDKPLVGVDFSFAEVTDVGLEHLEGLTSLQTLNLRFIHVTDVGLIHPKGQTSLLSL